MNWFSKKDNPIDIYEEHLLTSVKDGDTERLKLLLATELDVPAAVFNKALNKALDGDKVKTVETLLDNRKLDWSIDSTKLRDIVYDGNKTMFRVLHKANWDFNNIRFEGENAGIYNSFLRERTALWKKEIAYDALVEELKDAKRQLTEKESDFPEKVRFLPTKHNQPGGPGHVGGA